MVDVLVLGQSKEVYDSYLRTDMKRVRSGKLRLNRAKCKFRNAEISYRFTTEGLKIDTETI